MINNDTIRAKRRKRSANTIDLNDPVAMRLRIIRLEEEAERHGNHGPHARREQREQSA